MEKIEAELRGRMVALETLLGVAIAQIADTTADPADLIRKIMGNAEDMIFRTVEAAAPGDRQTAEFVQAAFDQIGDAMAAHLAQRARPSGQA